MVELAQGALLNGMERIRYCDLEAEGFRLSPFEQEAISPNFMNKTPRTRGYQSPQEDFVCF